MRRIQDMRIFIITLLILSVLACGSDPPIAPNPAEDLVGSWQPDNMNFPYFASDRLTYYLIDENIDSLTAQVRLQAARAIADAYVIFERVRIVEIRRDGTYVDTEGRVGKWSVELQPEFLHLVDSEGRQLTYSVSQHSIDYFEKSLNKEQFTSILKQLIPVDDEILAVLDIVFDADYIYDDGIGYAYRRR